MGEYIAYNDDWDRVLSRVLQPFDIRSFEVGPPIYPATVNQLIEAVTKATSLAPDSLASVTRSPSKKESNAEVFCQLQDALGRFGEPVPESIESTQAPNTILPAHDRTRHWRELAATLQCELPPLQPTRWLCVLIILPAYLFGLAIWIYLLHKLGFDHDPKTILEFLAGSVFTFCMLSTHLLPAIIATKLFIKRHRIPFASIAAMVNYIREKRTSDLQERFTRQIKTTIPDFVIEIVAEEFERPREEIGRDFPLIQTKPRTWQ